MEQRLCLFAQRSASLSINLHWKSTGARDQPAVCSVFRLSSVCFLEDKPVLTISYLFIFIFLRKCSGTIFSSSRPQSCLGSTSSLQTSSESSVVSKSPRTEQVLDGTNRGTLFIMSLYVGRAPRAGPRAIGRDLKSMVAQMGGLDT